MSRNDAIPPAAHGAYKFAPLVTASSVARFEIYAALDYTQKAAFYKVVGSTQNLQVWFTAGNTAATRVCTDLALTLNCSDGTIAPNGDATLFGGMSLVPYGYTASTVIRDTGDTGGIALTCEGIGLAPPVS